jgi:DNA-binding LytR/AlgR family response regulator
VEWFEAKGNYARLHRASDSFLFRMSLRELERRLDARRFLRVHRSAIVNLDHVRSVGPIPSGDAELVLASGARVRMSRRYAMAFHERTGR